MNLTQIQASWEEILLLPEGQKALQNDAYWQRYCKEHGWESFIDLRERFLLYQELLCYTIVEGIRRIFPYALKLLNLSNDQLIGAAEEYRRLYPNPSYQSHVSLRHFPDFIKSSARFVEAKEMHPYLVELAQYEWSELAVLDMPDPLELDLSTDLAGDWLDARLVWNALIGSEYGYDIPQIISMLQQGELEPSGNYIKPSYLVLYRDPESFVVRSLRLQSFAAQAMHVMTQDACLGLSCGQLIEVIANLLALDLQRTQDSLKELLETLLAKKVLLGLTR